MKRVFKIVSALLACVVVVLWVRVLTSGRRDYVEVPPSGNHRDYIEGRGESDSSVSLRIVRPDGGTEITFVGHVADQLPSTSIFTSLEAAAGFFSLGATGYSATKTKGHYHGMELHSLNWTVQPLAIKEAQSCFFDDRERFPPGSVELDCALLMRGIEHEWHSRPDLYVSSTATYLTTRPQPRTRKSSEPGYCSERADGARIPDRASSAARH